jgi:hypothetical protein
MAETTEQKQEVSKNEDKTPAKETRKQVKAKLQVKTFVLTGSEETEKEINDFLATIDNVSRFFNSKEVTKHADGVLITFWFLESIEEAPEVTELGQ